MTVLATFALAAAVFLLAAAPLAAGHGDLQEPPARNVPGSSRNSYCPHCGNGGGVCGDGGQWPQGSNYLGHSDGVKRTYQAGQVVELEVRITAHHKGHFEFHVCDEHLGELTPDPEGPGGCLSKWVLERVPPEESYDDCVPNDARGDCQPLDEDHPERWYLPPITGSHTAGWSHKMRFRLPQGLQCQQCTLQWRWWTANSCIPAEGYGCYFRRIGALGWNWAGPTAGWMGCSSALLQANVSSRAQALGRRSCGEEFRNCADIAIVGAAPTPAPTTPAPATTPAPTAAPTTARTTAAPMTTMTTTMPPTTALPASIQSGDRVTLRVPRSGHRVTVQQDGQVHAQWQHQGAWQQLVIQKTEGGAGECPSPETICHGDTVLLTGWTGKTLTVQGSRVHAEWDHRGAWQKFVVESESGGGSVAAGSVVFLRAHTGARVDADAPDSAGVVQARWAHQGEWQKLVIERPMTAPTPAAPTPAPTPAMDPRCETCIGHSACIWSDDTCYPAVARDPCEQLGKVFCGDTTGAQMPAPTPAMDPRCSACSGPSPCIWTDGKCYAAVAEGACKATSGAVWCGASLAQVGTQPRAAQTVRRKLKVAAHKFLALLQAGVSVGLAPASTEL